MKNVTNTPIVKDLVLIGGGHTHIAILKSFGMKPVPGLRLTLIARDVHTPYSGMLPGYIAGHYSYDESHIDLRPLAQFAGARLYHAEVEGLDLDNKRVLCAGRQPVNFDTLSINTGSRPGTMDVPGAAEFALPVKPIDEFLLGWESIQQRLLASSGRFRIVVVGGGAGGVELALSVQYRLRNLLKEYGKSDVTPEYHLISGSDEIMPTHNQRVRDKFKQALQGRGIKTHVGQRVTRLEQHAVHCSDASIVESDAVLWVTSASAPDWPRSAGLAVDDNGFIEVNDCLQSVSHSDVFAAGDIAAMVDHPRPKSGVFAVRQGKPLTENLRRAVAGKTLKTFKPQTNFLGLISSGDKYAIASRNNWSLEGAWVWRWKDWIDRRFMQKFSELPKMQDAVVPAIEPGLIGNDALKEISAIAMRCGGCGAKVGSTVLSRVVNQLTPIERDDVLIGLNAPDDAAVIEVPPGQVLVQSVDYFRSFIDDPYIFGRIAANHSLGDIFAMGAESQSAMAVATVPYGKESVVEEQLYQMMSGALEVLNESGTALVGGHSSEGAELCFGLSVTGLSDKARLMTKGGMQVGDALILTKPLGTGTLFAADMRQKAKGRWVHAALDSMMVSNQAGARCLHKYGATACTDVTGFGLLGHLVEMLRVVDADIELYPETLPVLDGAMDTIRAGIFSSLQPENVRLRRAIHDVECAAQHAHYPLLFDPQTAGGLLASVPQTEARACVDELRELGYVHTAIVGVAIAPGDAAESVHIMPGDVPPLASGRDYAYKSASN